MSLSISDVREVVRVLKKCTTFLFAFDSCQKAYFKTSGLGAAHRVAPSRIQARPGPTRPNPLPPS